MNKTFTVMDNRQKMKSDIYRWLKFIDDQSSGEPRKNTGNHGHVTIT